MKNFINTRLILCTFYAFLLHVHRGVNHKRHLVENNVGASDVYCDSQINEGETSPLKTSSHILLIFYLF